MNATQDARVENRNGKWFLCEGDTERPLHSWMLKFRVNNPRNPVTLQTRFGSEVTFPHGDTEASMYFIGTNLARDPDFIKVGDEFIEFSKVKEQEGFTIK